MVGLGVGAGGDSMAISAATAPNPTTTDAMAYHSRLLRDIPCGVGT
jgi:hypothetical protein